MLNEDLGNKLRGASSSAHRIDRAIMKTVLEETSDKINIERIKIACNPMRTESIINRISELEKKGCLIIYRHREKDTVYVHSLEITTYGKALFKDDRFCC